MIGLAALYVISAGFQLEAGVTPVQKVLQMMEEMKNKAIAEKEEEIKLFDTYGKWCKGTSTDKGHEIITSKDGIERQQAAIQKHSAAEVRLTDEIAEVDANIAQWQADKDAATAVRDTERTDYETTHADYSESVDALGRAVIALKKSQQSTPQAMMLIQKMALKARVPAGAKPIIAALLQEENRPTNPPVAAYESQSGGVVEMLENLEEQFQNERSALEKEEMEGKHAFNMLALSLSDQVAAGEKEVSKKSASLNEHKAANGAAAGALAGHQTDLKEDETYLAELVAECRMKSEAFENRQSMRAEELVALDKAIEIIASKVSGNADKHLPALVQTKATAMTLLRASRTSQVQDRAANLLAVRGAKIGSKRLSLLSVTVKNSAFDKVIQMIKDMISKLQEEAAAEGEHKAWCDGELKENKLTREAKTEEVNQLTATVDKLKAELVRLANSIAANDEAMAQLDSATAEATEIRIAEKAKNEETIRDAKEAIEAVAGATQVLKEFYAKAGDQAFLQGPKDDAPPSFENEAYGGNQGASKGVLGMLEVIHSDFARLLADTSADEAESEKQNEQFQAESAKDRETKRLDNLAMSRETTAKERDLSATNKDLSMSQEELDSALSYHEKLKPDCIAENLSFEERTQMRKEEIDSLNEVYSILSGGDAD